MKALFILLIAVAPHFAQAEICHPVGWFNRVILSKALEAKGSEMLNLAEVTVEQEPSRIRFRNVNSSQWYDLDYRLCGHKIEFSEIKPVN